MNGVFAQSVERERSKKDFSLALEIAGALTRDSGIDSYTSGIFELLEARCVGPLSVIAKNAVKEGERRLWTISLLDSTVDASPLILAVSRQGRTDKSSIECYVCNYQSR